MTQGSLPRIAVLGAAHWHAPLYRAGLARRFEVAVVQDSDVQAARTFAGPIDALATADVDDVLDLDDLDLVFVFSPHHEMLAIARRLVTRGLPFVIEKPAGVNLDELRSIEEDARIAGVPVAVPLVQRAAPIDTWLRRAGEITYERMAFVAGPPTRYEDNGNPWMLDPLLSGGGSLMNLGVHFVDLALRHLGHPADVVRKQSTVLHAGQVDDHATMILTTGTGREAIIEVGYAFPCSPLKRYCSFTAAGSNGFATVDTTGSASFTGHDGTTTTESLVVDSDPLYDVFVEAVADTLSDGFTGLPTLAELLETMELIWAAEPVEEERRG